MALRLNLLALKHFLNPRRLGYARIIGAVMWGVWILSLLLGSGNLDLGGQVVGTDYLQFYAAGLTLRRGQQEYLYDIPYQMALEQEIIGANLPSYHAFITPPFLAWLFVPLSLLPYGLSFAVWSLVNLGFLAVSIRVLVPTSWRRVLVWSLTWFVIFAAVSFGQNALLSLWLTTLVFVLWVKKRYLFAGLVASLILYKPQLVLGLGVLWLLDWRHSWRALVGLAAGGVGLAVLSFAFLPGASRAYIEFALHILPDLPSWQQFPMWHLFTVRGFWRLLLPGLKLFADALTFLFTALGFGAFVWLWDRRREDRELLFGAAMCLTLWVTPHGMVYDWALLLIPAVLFWEYLSRHRGNLRLLYTLTWLVALVSSGLTYAQLRFLPVAVQLSVPVLALTLKTVFDWLNSPPQPESDDMTHEVGI